MATKAEARRAPRRRGAHNDIPDNHNPVDIAMAAAASGKPLPDIARRVLEEQADLLHAQRIELRMRHVGEIVRAALWAILAVAAFAFLALVVAVVWRAAKSDALIVQSFRVPPALEARGLTGEVVATQVLDKLAEMQERTESVRAASTYANNWEDELKIDIPNTGATTDQLWKVLRGWLGKETRISGEIIDNGKGLTLTARVGAQPGQRFASETDDLDALVTQAAKLIYKKTQPYRYSVTLGETPEELTERFAVLRQLTRDPSPVERKWAFNGISVDLRNSGDFQGSIAMARRALAIDPNLLPAYANIGTAASLLGRDQQMVENFRQYLKLPRSSDYDLAVVAGNDCRIAGGIAEVTPDPAGLAEAASCMAAGSDSAAANAPFWRANSQIARHELDGPRKFQALPSQTLAAEFAASQTASVRLRAEIEQGPSPMLASALKAYADNRLKLEREGAGAAYYRSSAPAVSWPLQAQALSILGRHADAEALIGKSPLDCNECVRIRGIVAQAAGNPMQAQRWFARSAKLGPGMSAAYVDWGRLLARHRRFTGAEARFAKAAGIAPNWADPLKYWGDALAAQGKSKEALAKYDAALKLAPRWHELKAARARVAN